MSCIYSLEICAIAMILEYDIGIQTSTSCKLCFKN